MSGPGAHGGSGLVFGVHPSDDRAYAVDGLGFLVDAADWTEDFAEATARSEAIRGGLTAGHWQVIRIVRELFLLHGQAPAAVRPCRALGLRYADLMALFPTGYRHGVLKLAGLPDEAIPTVDPRRAEAGAASTG